MQCTLAQIKWTYVLPIIILLSVYWNWHQKVVPLCVLIRKVTYTTAICCPFHQQHFLHPFWWALQNFRSIFYCNRWLWSTVEQNCDINQNSCANDSHFLCFYFTDGRKHHGLVTRSFGLKRTRSQSHALSPAHLHDSVQTSYSREIKCKFFQLVWRTNKNSPSL